MNVQMTVLTHISRQRGRRHRIHPTGHLARCRRVVGKCNRWAHVQIPRSSFMGQDEAPSRKLRQLVYVPLSMSARGSGLQRLVGNC
jgi:hypothetical protein